MYEKITPPATGSRITFQDGKPIVPDDLVIPFIRGNGTGVDIWPAKEKVINAAVETAYGGQRKINWFKVYAGDKACEQYGTYQYLPQDTLNGIEEYGIAIKVPLIMPIGGGIRSLSLLSGTPFSPQKLDVIVYQENTEDIYLGTEWRQGTEIAEKLIHYLNTDLIPATPEHGKKQIPLDSGIGVKPISKTGSQRLVRRAIQNVLRLPKEKQSVTLIHKEYTEGAFRDWGYELATTEFHDVCVTEQESWILSNKECHPDIKAVLDSSWESHSEIKIQLIRAPPCTRKITKCQRISRSH